MNQKLTLCLALLFGAHTAIAATTANPVDEPHPVLPIPTAQTIATDCDKDIAAARAKFKAIESGKDRRNIFAAMNELSIFIEDKSGPDEIIANVSTDKATRDAADNCTVKYAPFQTDIFQSERLYQRVKAAKTRDAVEAAYKQDLLEGFEDSGVSLPPAKRQRVKAISEELANLAKDFERNIREDGTTLAFTETELEGVPRGVVEKAKRDSAGKVIITLAYPEYVPVMENARSGVTREKLWRAKQNEGGEKNLKLMDQITNLRAELGALYGYPDYASLTLRRKMAGDPKTVMDFLATVRTKILDLEKKELEELRAYKADLDKTALAQTEIKRWDVSYLQTQLKRTRYNVDQEALRKYFPTEASVRYMLRLAESLYGVKFVEATAPTWHADVRVMNMFDAASSKFMGSVYLDLYPRPDKYNHAAVWPVRNASTLTGRTPIPVLVTNLNREGLTQDELETLLHEFGHALHGLMSTARFNAQAGTSVKRDFVEAPSQMFEEWARREEPLKFFAQVCGPQCPVLSKQQIEQLDKAHKFGRGLRYTAQWSYSMLDMALTHERKDASVLAAWQRIQGQTSLGYVPGTMFPAGFGHLAGGYAAGYYGYMWSEVLALDMLSAFGGNMLDQKVGQQYRNRILAQGGQKPPNELVESFLGRKSNSEAFFKEITGQR
jgi:thimet oligopeptidase